MKSTHGCSAVIEIVVFFVAIAVGSHQSVLETTANEKEAPMTSRAFHEGEYGWIFLRYVSSDLERSFYDDVQVFEHNVSWAPLVDRYFENVSRLLSQQSRRVFPHLGVDAAAQLTSECELYVADARQAASVDQRVASRTCFGDMSGMDKTLFSRFEYEFVCLEPPCTKPLPSGRALGEIHTSYIEPLFGYLRHPRNFIRDGQASLNTVLNKEYMIVDKWALNHLYVRWKQRQRNSFFFDMGASTYGTGLGGSSQNWFVGLSECMCVPFTEMRLWEATTVAPHNVWKPLARQLMPHYFWYNYPLSVNFNSWRNPLRHLTKRVSRDGSDAVIVKIDFDSPHLERTLIESIIQHDDISSRIDELFFEHHVKLGGMVRWWKDAIEKDSTVRHSIDLFLQMRKKGIRAHSWV